MARGFFTKDQIVSAPDCDKCKLDRECKSPRMPVSGNGQMKALIIGEAPGATEDLRNTQFVGDSGDLLREELTHLGLDLDRDFWKMNALSCRPPKNRTPSKSEIAWCRVNVTNTIARLKPEHIILLGGSAVNSFYMGHQSNCSISMWRGRNIPDYDISNSWVHPIFHPSYILRTQRDGDAALNIFREDLAVATSMFGHTIPERYHPEKQVTCLYDFDDVVAALKWILEVKPPVIAFDYETTGLKPFRQGHRIDTLAISNGDWCYSFPVMRPGHFSDQQQKEVLRLWRRILLHPGIALVAHNLKFEDMWSRVIVGCEPSHWLWDTMTTQHLIDERPGTKGLKWQGYVRWGLWDWDGEMKDFLRAPTSNEFNMIHMAPLDKLLFYNGIDAVVTYRLWQEQQPEVKNEKQEFMVDFFREGLEVLSEMTDHGVPVNEEYYLTEDANLDQQIKEQIEKLEQEPGVQKYKEIKRVFPDFQKDDQVRYLLFDVLGHERIKETTGGDDSVDKEVLGVIGTPLTEGILHYRRLNKVKGTYIGQMKKEMTDGFIHPFFDLHLARTGRSSSSYPNFQNIPVRVEEAKRSSRSGIIPLPGHRLCEIDYGSLEVRVIGMATRDPNLMAYLFDPTTDMHRDQAEDIFIIPESDVTGQLRFHAKNGFVFAEFYGSWYKSCARSIFNDCWYLETKQGVKICDHMAANGIRGYDDFEAHMYEVEERFWNRFPVVKEWQERTIAFHEQYGYVENLFGFRRRGALSRNEIVNSPIQGTGFQLLLWSLIQMNKIRRQERWNSALLGQIHDSMLLSIDPAEEKHVICTANRVMTQDIRERFDWICVPLEVEPEMTEIDASWYTKKKVDLSLYIDAA